MFSRRRPGARGRVLGFACALLLASAPARAHDVSYAHVELRWTAARLEGSLTVHPDDAALVLEVPMPEWFRRQDFLDRAGPALADSLRGRLVLRAGGRAIAWVYRGARPDPEGRGVQVAFTASLERPPASLEVEGPVFPTVPNHETFVSVYRDGVLIRQDVLTTGHRVLRVYGSGTAGVAAVLRTFVPAGIHHIAIGPDHILFVLGLLLLGGGLARLLKIITSFTVAHSITLALASLGLVRLPTRLVEPLIALSIVFVAVETLLSGRDTPRSGADPALRARDRRAVLAFAFGLVHGFGFASVLAEFGLPREALGWSLACFNVGVEMGQAVIVLLVAPPLAWLAHRAPVAHAQLVRVLAFGIAAAGGFWFVQRLLTRA
jgi:HupE/UreJ protein